MKLLLSTIIFISQKACDTIQNIVPHNNKMFSAFFSKCEKNDSSAQFFISMTNVDISI